MFAVTERLLLRPGWIEDAPALAAAIADEAVVRNLARVPWPYGPGDAEAFLGMPQDPLRPRFLIFKRDTAELVGGIGLHDDDANLGYWIARAHWGRGFATEAGRAVCALSDGSLRLPRLKAHHAVDNPASGKVLSKLGFRAGGQARLHVANRGGEVDVRFFARDRAGEPEQLAA